MTRRHKVEVEQEPDGRWLAEVVTIPGCMTYGASQEEAVRHAVGLAFRIFAEKVEAGEIAPRDASASFAAA